MFGGPRGSRGSSGSRGPRGSSGPPSDSSLLFHADVPSRLVTSALFLTGGRDVVFGFDDIPHSFRGGGGASSRRGPPGPYGNI